MGADFSGYASKANQKCSDGRTIMPHAFQAQDGTKVPLVYAHSHTDPGNIMGHAILENRDDGVYAYGYFNDTPQGKNGKLLVEHGDIDSMSIWANQLKENAKTVVHGVIREVSLVLSGANPGAKIDFVSIQHADGEIENMTDEAIIFTGLELEHEDLDEDDDENLEHAAEGATVQDVLDTLNEDQRTVFETLIGAALESNAGSTEAPVAQSDNEAEGDLVHQEGTLVSRNAFDQNDKTDVANKRVLTHDAFLSIVAEAKRNGSLKEAIQDYVLAHSSELGLAHDGERGVDYGITNIEMLFPDAAVVGGTPEWITRRMEWVSSVLNGVRKIPTARWKSRSADLTFETARAKGYITGSMKKNQFFAVAQRENSPTTIYKKQQLDRDDIIDVTEFDVVGWIWGEMRLMLDEEVARAILVGDGREIDNPDKINEDKIRPIAQDDDFYAHRVTVGAGIVGEALIEAVLRARKYYKGSGNPTFYTTEDMLTDLLLIRETDTGRRMYPTQAELYQALRVSNIVAVEILEGATTSQGDLLGIFVNMSDYTVGTDRGGQITTFDDFDIKFNQYQYLIEGRMSGALSKYKTALVLTRTRANGSVIPTEPTFVPATGVITIIATTGVVYKNKATGVTLSAGPQTALAEGASLEVMAVPATGYIFPHNTDADWNYTRPSA